MGFVNDYYKNSHKSSQVTFTSKINNNLRHYIINVVLLCYVTILKMASRFVAKKNLPKNEPVEILLTGTFFSDNWISSLLQPLALSKRVLNIRMVADKTLPPIVKVTPIYPAKLLRFLIGRTPARLLTFIWVGFRTRPHIIGGLHLLVNGLAAILLGRITGSLSLYSCCGGPAECEGGGYKSDNNFFSKLQTPNRNIERHLLTAVQNADLVITRGQLAINFFKNNGATTRLHAIPGGMDGTKFSPSSTPKEIDLITVGNLIHRKRVDIFIEIVHKLKKTHTDIKAIILGDGPLRDVLVAKVEKLGLEKNIFFAGHRKDVDKWLKKAKIFLLTSESEGLSQAMIQAMLSGLPAIVSSTGEAGELVKNGVSGYLVELNRPDAFITPILSLLNDSKRLSCFSKEARRISERCDVQNLGYSWDKILDDMSI